MWLIPKDTSGMTNRVAISDGLKAALVRWYIGKGDEADHRASVSLVVTSRENGKWLACDCLAEDRSPPLMSPAYLSFQETYYLTPDRSSEPQPQVPVLHAASATTYPRNRPRHTLRDQAARDCSTRTRERQKLAQKPDKASQTTDPAASPSQARQLLGFCSNARSNVLRELPPEGPRDGSISAEMRRLREVAGQFEIAPGIKLAHHFYTNAIEYEKCKVHARLREAEGDWPEEYAPQAFLLQQAGDKQRDRDRARHSADPKSHTARIIRAKSSPLLVLAVVGEHSKREGYRALRAYAQPVFTGNQFVPAERDHDRDILLELQKAQYSLRRHGIRMAVKKILFDIETEHGSARPDFLVAVKDQASQRQITFALQILQSPIAAISNCAA